MLPGTVLVVANPSLGGLQFYKIQSISFYILYRTLSHLPIVMPKKRAAEGSKSTRRTAKKSRGGSAKTSPTSAPPNDSDTPLIPREILKTATFIKGSCQWIGNIFSTHGDNFNFFFVFATTEGCFFVQHYTDQRFHCEGGDIRIPDNAGENNFGEPDAGQPFLDETGNKPKWLEDQFLPYKHQVEQDPCTFINEYFSTLKEGQYPRMSLMIFGRQPLRELLRNVSSGWSWGLKWEGITSLCKYPGVMTNSDRFLLVVLVCLDFSEHSMVYDVNGLLSRDILIEDEKKMKCDLGFLSDLALGRTVMTAEDFPGHETRSKKDAKKLLKKTLKNDQDRWWKYVAAFEYEGR